MNESNNTTAKKKAFGTLISGVLHPP